MAAEASASGTFDLQPRIADLNGYEITVRDLQFLQISGHAIERWCRRSSPLGLDEEQFRYFIETLRVALEKDGVADCDVRLKGSSSTFFSSVHKTMPYSRDDLYDTFRQCRKREPVGLELERIERALLELWPEPDRPLRRPFDALYRLGVDRVPSDLDLQVSSNIIDARVRNRLNELSVSPTAARIENPKYNFFHKSLIAEVCEHLMSWAAHISDVVQRDVSIAAFPESGPPDTSELDGELSAHKKPSDWALLVGGIT